MAGYNSANEKLFQTVKIPSTITTATLSFSLHIDTQESGSTAYDKLSVQVRNSSGTLLGTLATFSNANSASGYQTHSYDMSAYKGQTVEVYFAATTDGSLPTNFVIDNVSLNTH
jgi:hypothetical protein